MTWYTVLAGAVVVILLLGQIRLGGGVRYSAKGLSVKARVGAFRLSVYPIKDKKQEKKKPPPKKPKKEKPEEEQQEKGGSLVLLKQCLPLVGQAAGELKRKIRIDRLTIFFTAASDDPANAALVFGYANMGMGMIWPIFSQNFVVKEHDLRTSVDFDADAPTVYIDAALSLKLGQLVSFGARYGIKLLGIYLKNKRASAKPLKNQKEAI